MSVRKSAPRVYMTARVTGTGDVALLDVYSANHNTFGQAYAPGDVAPYCIVGGGKQEIGDGTFIDENTFRRDTVWSTSDNVRNTSSTEPVAKIVFADNSDVQIFVAPHPWSVLQTNTDGSLANASPFRKSIALALLSDLGGEEALTDGDAVYVMEADRWFQWQASNATAADDVNIFEADAYDVGRWVGLGDNAGSLTIDGTAAAGAFIDLYSAKKATYPTRYARWLMDASSNALRLAMRWGQASLTNFISVFTPGTNADRIEFHKPVVLPARSNLQGVMDRTLAFDSTAAELAVATADAANDSTAADNMVIPRVKGTYLLGVYETVADLRAIDAAKYAKSNQRALVLGRADGGDADPFYVEWFPTNSDSNDDWVTFRPSTGAAASGNGRWKRVTADVSQSVTNVATPSIASGNWIILNSGLSHPVTDIGGEYPGAIAILQRGDEDVVITHDAAKLSLINRSSRRLTADNPRMVLSSIGGVWYELGAGSIGGKLNVLAYGADASGSTSNSSAFQAAYDAAAAGQCIVVPIGSYNFVTGVSGTKNVVWEIEGTLTLSGYNWSDILPGVISYTGQHTHLNGVNTTMMSRNVVKGLGLTSSVDVDVLAYDFNDNVVCNGGSRLNGLVFYDRMQAGAKGIRQAMSGQVFIEGQSANTTGDAFYVGVQAGGFAVAPDNGTNPTTDAKGALFGMSSFAQLKNGATAWHNVTSCEFNVTCETGSSVYYRSGIQIAGGGSVRGSVHDYAISISNLSGATTFKVGIGFGNQNGGYALGSDSTAISINESSILHGLAFNNTNVTGSYILGDALNIAKGNAQFTGLNQLMLIGHRTSANTPTFYWFSSGNTTPDATLQVSGGTGANNASMTVNVTEFVLSGTYIRPASDNAGSLGAGIYRFAEGFITNLRPGTGTAIWTSGSGTPEGAVTAPVGSLYTRTNGGAGTTLYVKESGSGNTGWVAK